MSLRFCVDSFFIGVLYEKNTFGICAVSRHPPSACGLVSALPRRDIQSLSSADTTKGVRQLSAHAFLRRIASGCADFLYPYSEGLLYCFSACVSAGDVPHAPACRRKIL